MREHKFISRCQIALLFLSLLIFFSAQAQAQESGPALGGTVEAQLGDRIVNFPTLRSDYRAEVEGDLVTVTLTQTFANPAESPLNATYLFPLPTRAAVYQMEMEVGDERIRAQIQKVQQARATFEQAKSEGRAAALLTQKRPNMFTQEIANLMPGLPVKVTISYVQAAERVDGYYELVMPLLVGPRYQPVGRGEENGGELAGAGQIKADGRPPISVDENKQARADTDKPYGVWELESLPAYPPVSGLTLPKIIDEDRVSLAVNIKAGQAISHVFSPSHTLAEKKISDRQISLSLAGGRTIDNRDFILQWRLSGEEKQAGLLAHKDERGGFFSLLIEPPAVAQPEDVAPREMVFVLDASGSMDGAPLRACQKFMNTALKNLRPTDYFRIVTFDNTAREFSEGALAAKPENIQAGLDFVKNLRAGGGTEAATGIRQALAVPQHPDTLRLVVFMTDGYIGNEAEVLALINSLIGRARILSFGVGTSVNRFLLEEMAREGRGWSRILDPTDNVDEVVTGMAARLESPLLTDITVDWGGAVTELAPEPIPDLFAGQSIRVMGRYEGAGTREIVVKGLVGGREARLPIKVELPEASEAGAQAIPLIWAREQIADLSRQYNRPPEMRVENLSNDFLKDRITEMGLTYNLVTTWTAFVAVSEKIVNEGAKAQDAPVPLPQVKGLEAPAYGLPAQAPAPTPTPSFSGSSTPEPATMGGLALMGVAAWRALRRKRQRA